MKKQKIEILSAICVAICLTGCSGFSKMSKDADKVHYAVTPNPMQDNGDSVNVKIVVKYPTKYFAKKAIVTVVPTLKLSDGTEKTLKEVTLVGEKAAGSGIKINYRQGGDLNYTDKVAYIPAMKTDELFVFATLENNKKNFLLLKLRTEPLLQLSFWKAMTR
jgi:hypothetical protein